jgi:hypothetical protein
MVLWRKMYVIQWRLTYISSFTNRLKWFKTTKEFILHVGKPSAKSGSKRVLFVLSSLIILFARATLSGFCVPHYLFGASRSQSGKAGCVFSFFITSHSARVTSLIFPPPSTQWLCVCVCFVVVLYFEIP